MKLVRIDKLASLNQKEVRQTIRKDKNGNKIHVSLIATAIVINNEIVAHPWDIQGYYS